MQYLIYFAVAMPLLLGWLFWTTAEKPQPPPMFHSFADTLDERAAANMIAVKSPFRNKKQL